MNTSVKTKSVVRRFIALGLLCAGVVALAAPETPGSLVLVGGALRKDNTEVWERIVQLAGGPDAPIAVFASASINPKGSGASVVDALNNAGAKAFFVPVAVKLAEPDYRQAAADPEWVSRVSTAKGVFFTGGDQGRITQALRLPNGNPTPILDAVWSVYRKGGVIAGTSAGTAIMSTTMFHDAMPVLATLKDGVGRPGVMGQGLGFIGPDIFADQHLLTRGRFARMLPAMLAHGYRLGLGVDENSAAVVTGGNKVEVIGYKGALVVDLAEARRGPAGTALDLSNIKLSYLSRGDRFDLATKTFVPTPEKGQRMLDSSKHQHTVARFYPDILGNTTVVDLMQNLIDNVQPEAVGLAFGGPQDPSPELGFEFRFRKGKDSAAYDTGKLGGEDISVVNIYLDVRPIVMSTPMYRLRTAP